jgi:hypothetical protein
MKNNILILILFTLINGGFAQKNNALFLIHEVPESNLLNPAIDLPCKWYLGLPALSSLHVNYENSTFTFNQLFMPVSGSYRPSILGLKENLHSRNSISTELHAQLFALGYKRKNTSYYFTVTEKDNLMFTYPKNTILYFLEGNVPFIGEEFNTNGTAINFNHYREFALGISAPLNKNLRLGGKAKLLFGKLNINTKAFDLNQYTDPTTYFLDLSSDLDLRTSLPIQAAGANLIENQIAMDPEINALQLAFNRKNPGFSIDLGVIYDYSERMELSASMIDLGFIFWGSNVNVFQSSSTFHFQGISTSSGTTSVNSIVQDLIDMLEMDISQQSYMVFLAPKFMGGFNYSFNKGFEFGMATNLEIHSAKILYSTTLVGQYKPLRWFGLAFNYSIQNYSYNNLGGGIYLGHQPVQFYFVSDNLMFIPNPLDTRNANVRLGINILWGCKKKQKHKKTGKKTIPHCFGVEDPNRKTYRENIVPWEKRQKAKQRKQKIKRFLRWFSF